MLYYAEVAMGHGEVPHMRCLCIHVSGCRQRCRHCQSPALQQPDFGDLLLPALADILQLYTGRCDCVCFLGEGSAGETERRDAFAKLSMQQYQQEMQGIYSSCVQPNTLDEAPMAYKSLDEILQQITPTAQVLQRIQPLYNFKAAE